jgi:hypothetical protein
VFKVGPRKLKLEQLLTFRKTFRVYVYMNALTYIDLKTAKNTINNNMHLKFPSTTITQKILGPRLLKMLRNPALGIKRSVFSKCEMFT